MKLAPESLSVLENVPTAPGHYRLRLASKRIAKLAQPGQFVQITVADGGNCDPLLPRPFSFLEIGNGWFDLLYQVVGRGTQILSKKKKGDTLTVLGPLGQGWRLPSKSSTTTTHVLVGGGVGIPPLHHWAQELLKQKKASAKNIHVFLGGRNKDLLHCEKQFTKLGIKPVVATEDGSKGHKGFVTTPLSEYLESVSAPSPAWCAAAQTVRGGRRENSPRALHPAAAVAAARIQIYTCGPTPMLKAVSAVAAQYAAACQVSVEEPMPCGFGVCLGCAIKVKDDCGGHRFALSCTEGPVFDAPQVIWS